MRYRGRFVLRYLAARTGEVEGLWFRGPETRPQVHRAAKRAGMRVVY